MKRVVWPAVLALVLSLVVTPAGGARAGRAPKMTRLSSPVVEIWKAQRAMELRDGERVVRRFVVALGLDPKKAKRIRGDLRTPVGRYYVSDKRPDSPFHRFLGISYPNTEDAERGYQSKVIDADQWVQIFLANLRGDLPSWRTALGGRVGIHGYGGRPLVRVDWTEGCIAVSDEEIEFLYERVPIGTPVIIHH